MSSYLRDLNGIDILRAPSTHCTRLTCDQRSEFVSELGYPGDRPVFENAVTDGGTKCIPGSDWIGCRDRKPRNFDERSIMKHCTTFRSECDPYRSPTKFLTIGAAELFEIRCLCSEQLLNHSHFFFIHLHDLGSRHELHEQTQVEGSLTKIHVVETQRARERVDQFDKDSEILFVELTESSKIKAIRMASSDRLQYLFV